MPSPDIRDLGSLQRARQKLQAEQQMAIAGIKQNVRTDIDLVKTKTKAATAQLASGLNQAQSRLPLAADNWKLPALGGLGALLGVLLITWLTGNKNEEQEETNEATVPAEPWIAKPSPNTTENELPLEQRIKAALAEYDAEKEAANATSPFISLLSTLGPILFKELKKSGWLNRFYENNFQSQVEAEFQNFSDRMADELEELKDTL